MEDQDFSIKDALKHIKKFFRAKVKLILYKLGDKVGKILTLAIIGVLTMIFAPLFLTIVFIALGFGFKEWLPVLGYGFSFLLSATAVLIISLILILIGIIAIRKPKAKIYQKIIDINEKWTKNELKAKSCKEINSTTSEQVK